MSCRVVICGQGPSWADVDPGDIARARERGAVVIAVNGAIDHVEADYFFTLDLSRQNRERVNDPREGVRYVVACPVRPRERLSHVTYLERIARDADPSATHEVRVWQEIPGGLSEDVGAVHTGNSAFGALNLAYHWRASRIVLLGVDGHGRRRWDGSRNRCMDHLPTLFESAYPQLHAAGIRVVNGSPDSAVDCFPTMPPDRALKWLVSGKTR